MLSNKIIQLRSFIKLKMTNFFFKKIENPAYLYKLQVPGKSNINLENVRFRLALDRLKIITVAST